jgi:hypothetical protein
MYVCIYICIHINFLGEPSTPCMHTYVRAYVCLCESTIPACIHTYVQIFLRETSIPSTYTYVQHTFRASILYTYICTYIRFLFESSNLFLIHIFKSSYLFLIHSFESSYLFLIHSFESSKLVSYTHIQVFILVSYTFIRVFKLVS